MKQKTSKLDPFAERLTEWFLAGKTLEQAQQQLRLDGCSVSLSRLSDWWQREQQRRLQERVLSQIATGSRQCQDVEKAFGKDPAPDVEALMKLHRLIAFQLASASSADPELVQVAERATRMVLEFAKLDEKRADRALEERRVKLLEEKAAQAELALKVTESALTAEEKASRMKQIFGLG